MAENASRIGETYLYAPALGIGHIRNTDGSGAVTCRVGQHNRSLEAGNQTLVGVGGCIDEGIQRTGVFDNPSNVVQRCIRQTTVFLAAEQVLAFLAE